jgi:release factor glutamine methyltransferase
MAIIETYQNAVSFMETQLGLIYPAEETTAICRSYLSYLLNVNTLDVLMNRVAPLSAEQQKQLEEDTDRLMGGEPLQYITGEAYFLDRTFKVGPGVLIPRPETEELVDWIIQEHSQIKGKVLDIGCGSGCIAVSLAAGLPNAEVFAFDISDTALAYTQENALLNNVVLQYIKDDILQEQSLTENEIYDLMVSNPPYVLQSEKSMMQANVLNYEPHLALFVDDADALLFYHAIAKHAIKHLSSLGWLYFEINEQKGDEIVEMLEDAGFQEIEVRMDINGKERMVRAQKT